jgi:hypothetical protein
MMSKLKPQATSQSNVLTPTGPFKLDTKNARKHGARNKKLVRDSLAEVGAFRSIAVDGEGIVRAGNETYAQALALGLKIKPVEAAPNELVAVVRKDLIGRKAERAALLDNGAGATSEWDAQYLTALAGSDAELLNGIFTEDELLEMEAEAAMGWDESKRYAEMRNETERAKYVEIVVAVEAHEQIERAIDKAREMYQLRARGDALAKVCEMFLCM